MTQSSFFRAFASKEALLLELVRRMFGGQFDLAGQHSGAADPVFLYAVETALSLSLAEAFKLQKNSLLFLSEYPELSPRKRELSAISLEVVQQQVGHLRADLAHDRAADIAVVPARAAGAVAAQAGGEHVRVLHGRSVECQLAHSLAHGPCNVVGIGPAGVVIVI